MKLQVIGCSHHTSSVSARERLAFSPEQARVALGMLRTEYPGCETVVLSTCNRVELYFAAEEDARCPTHMQVVDFLSRFHGVTSEQVFDELFERAGEDAIRHLFTVAGSLDSMVVGEAQILSQVKQAYEQATAAENTGPLTHAAFQAAIRVAKRVARETAVNQKRVSVPSVAVGDFARQFFERFDDKRVIVIGAGEMGEETVRYLKDEGARQITIVNRSPQRAAELATRLGGEVSSWDRLHELLVHADLVVSTTGATEPIVRLDEFRAIDHERGERPLVVLDLAVPRDFDPDIGNLAGVYLYSVDDLKRTCEANRKAREKEWPKAERIIEEETRRFMADLNHRSTGPTIRRLRQLADEIKSEELQRLLNKLGPVDERIQRELRGSFDRLVNKLLHPPLESLRDEAERGTHHGLLEALRRLFQIGEH
ncbi:MAG: glutamyl-tRNA reductase [Pirellulaceae bacterium]